MIKKYFFFLTIFSIFLSHCAQEQEPLKRLLFPFPGKNVNDLWMLVRNDWHIYACLHDILRINVPNELLQRIIQYWVELNNPRAFSSANDQLFRKLLGCCITLSCKEKKWNLPTDILLTHDGRYYVYSTPSLLMIYDKKLKRRIAQFDRDPYSEYKLLKQRNVLLFSFDDTMYLYDIEKKESYMLFREIAINDISCSGNYIIGHDTTGCYVWNVTDLDTINLVWQEMGNIRYVNAKFNYDESNLAIFSDHEGTLKVLAIHDGGVREVASCYLGKKKQSSMHFAHTNKHIVIYDKYGSCIDGIAIKEDGMIVLLQQSFHIDGLVWSKLGADLLVINKEKQLTITNYRGIELQKLGYVDRGACMCSPSGKHIYFYLSTNEGQRNRTMMHLLYDAQGDYCGMKQDILNNSGRLYFNPQETVLIRFDTYKEWNIDHSHIHDKDGCLDLTGKMLKILDIDVLWPHFHPNGRVLLCGGTKGNKKYVLYPQGADDHLKNITNRQLTCSQYGALGKICSEVEKLREKKDILKVHNS